MTEVATIIQELENVKDRIQGAGIWETDYRNQNVIIFGMEEMQNEDKWDTEYNVLDIFASELHLNLNKQLIAHMVRV